MLIERQSPLAGCLGDCKIINYHLKVAYTEWFDISPELPELA
jgi:hypothetical protein